MLETQQSQPVRYLSDAVTYTSDPAQFFRIVNFAQIAQNLLGLGHAEPKSCSVYLYGHTTLPAPFSLFGGKQEHGFKRKNADVCVDTTIRKLRKQRPVTSASADDPRTMASILISAILEQVQHQTKQLRNPSRTQRCAPRLYLKAFQISSCSGQVVDLLQALGSLQRGVESSHACPYYLVDSLEESTRMLRVANFKHKNGWQTVLIAAVVLGLSAPPRTCENVCGARVRLINVTGSGSPPKLALGAFRDACMQRATLFSSLDLCTSVLDAQRRFCGQPNLHSDLRCDTQSMVDECHQTLLSGTETADPVNETEVIVLFAEFPIMERSETLHSKLFNQAMSTLRFGDILSRARNVTYRRYSNMKNQDDSCDLRCSNSNTKLPSGPIQPTARVPTSALQYHQCASTTLQRRVQPRVGGQEKNTATQISKSTRVTNDQAPQANKFCAPSVQRHGVRDRTSGGRTCNNSRVLNKAQGPRDIRRKELVDLQRCIDELSIELEHRQDHAVGSKTSMEESLSQVASKTTKDSASTLTSQCQRVPNLNLYPDSRSGTVLHVPLPLDCPVPSAMLKRFSRICHCGTLTNNTSPPVPRQEQPCPAKKSVPSPRSLDWAASAKPRKVPESMQKENFESSTALHADLSSQTRNDEVDQRLPKQPKAASVPKFTPPPRLDGYFSSKVGGDNVNGVTTGKLKESNSLDRVDGLDMPSLSSQKPHTAVSTAQGSFTCTNYVSTAGVHDTNEDTANQANDLNIDVASLLNISNCKSDKVSECGLNCAKSETSKSMTSDQVSSKPTGTGCFENILKPTNDGKSDSTSKAAESSILLNGPVSELNLDAASDSEFSSEGRATDSEGGTPIVVRRQRQGVTDAIEKLLNRLGTLANATGKRTMHRCLLTDPEQDRICSNEQNPDSAALANKKEFGKPTRSVDDVTPLLDKKCVNLCNSKGLSSVRKKSLQIGVHAASTPGVPSARKAPKAHTSGIACDGCELATPNVSSGNSSFQSDTTPSMSPFSAHTFLALPVVAPESKSMAQHEVDTDTRNTVGPQSPRKPAPSQFHDETALQRVQLRT